MKNVYIPTERATGCPALGLSVPHFHDDGDERPVRACGEVAPSRHKNKGICFVLLSTFRNFGFAEVTSSRKSTNRFGFSLDFS